MANTNLNPADPFGLDRFATAQEPVYVTALSEIKAGEKRTHWMWFIFPQIAGLGSSSTSQFFAIKSIDEARAYLAHPVLGPRLRECAQAALGTAGRSAAEIFGFPDDRKLHSSATLFAAVAEPGSVFERLLEKFFGGQKDGNTVKRLAKSQ